MADKTLTVTTVGGDPKTLTFNRDRFAGVRSMTRVEAGGATTDITVDRTARVVTSDRKGESRPLLTKVVGGASVAYSLRDLNDKAGSSKVVRVRRASDNLEKDFLAKEVKDIEAWVNGQVVLPLDVRELVDGERTGDIVEAEAAYSLRNLSSTYTGDVVEVRRNTDGATKDFNATEVSDGTLTDWVNTSILPLDAATGALAAYSLRNLSASYTGPVVAIRRSSDDEEEEFTAAEVADGTLADWVGAGNDGFVYLWHDQTGDLAEADQYSPAKQPKIVENGVFLGGLVFDGTDDVLQTNVYPDQALTLIGVANVNVLNSPQSIVGAGDGTPDGSYLGLLDTNVSVLGNEFGTLTGGSISSGTNFLLFGVFAADKRLLSTNGAAIDNEYGEPSGNTDYTYSIGAFNNAGTNESFVNGKVSEVIIYPSDQSDKRRVIEENIGSNYGITLVDAFSKEGTVSTWYDQSGQTNHAIQGTPAKQPHIVKAGILVDKGIDFDGESSQTLQPPLLIPSIQNSSAFVINTPRSTSTGYTLMANRSLDRMYFKPDIVTIGNPAHNFSAGMTAGVRAIQTVTATSGGLFTYFKDGGSVGTTNYTGAIGGGDSWIGSGQTGSGEFDGIISEIIIYRSDQTENRTAIEANIGEAYNIDLPSGVDTGYDEVDGFVETWYDQSGNGRDSIQAVATRQPIIVEAGVFQDGLKFTHTDITNGKRMYVPRNTSELGTEFALVWVGKITLANTGFSNILGGIRNVQSYNSGSVGISTSTNSQSLRVVNEQTSNTRQLSTNISSAYTIDEDFVAFVNYDDDDVVTLSVDGNATTDTFSGTVLTSTADLRIMAGQSASGARGGSYRTQESPTGICREVLVYDTNQSANRPAIEANINNQYDLY